MIGSLFGAVAIPPAVADELDRGRDLVGDWRSALPSVGIHAVNPSPLLDLLRAEVDPGEAEALALAAQEQAALLLIDDAQGRIAARRMGISVVGSAGMVILARRRGLISAGRPLLDDLRTRGGLWLAEPLYRALLAQLDEA